MGFSGTIPAGPMIGGIIDKSCILWQEECGERGSCYAYDNEKMGEHADRDKALWSCPPMNVTTSLRTGY